MRQFIGFLGNHLFLEDDACFYLVEIHLMHFLLILGKMVLCSLEN